MTEGITLPHDWFPRPLPPNVEIGPRSWLGSSYSFLHCQSRRPCVVRIGHDTGVYLGTMFELGPAGEVEIGNFCTVVGATIRTNGRVLIEDYALVSYDVVIADTFAAVPPEAGGSESSVPRISVAIRRNAWIAAGDSPGRRGHRRGSDCRRRRGGRFRCAGVRHRRREPGTGRWVRTTEEAVHMNQPYTTDYYAALRDGARSSARVIVPLVLELAPVCSVVDVGCGQGTWLSVFHACGVKDVLGVDGDYIDRDRLEIPHERFRPRDLVRPLELDRTFDLAVSLEVAEHLPADVAESFVGSLARLAPVVLFSAAAPYQGGESHVNEQWPAYWAERFARHGFLPVDCLRRRLWANADVEWWYAQNTFLFVERVRLERDAALKREYESAGPHALPLVHPRRYLEWIEWGLSLCGGEVSPVTQVGPTE